MKAFKCDKCGHIMTKAEYDDVPECPMYWEHSVTVVRYRKCNCDVCKSEKVKTVSTNKDYAQFVLRLIAPNRTELEEELFLHAAVGLIGESGELLDKVKKVFWQRHPMDNKWFDAAILELGDCLFYIQFMCNNLGVSLDEIRDRNVAKLSARYKNKRFTTNESINRKEPKWKQK